MFAHLAGRRREAHPVSDDVHVGPLAAAMPCPPPVAGLPVPDLPICGGGKGHGRGKGGGRGRGHAVGLITRLKLSRLVTRRVVQQDRYVVSSLSAAALRQTIADVCMGPVNQLNERAKR